MSDFQMTPCHSCGFIAEEWSLVMELEERRAPPDKGSLMVCIACGAMSLVDESSALGLHMRELTPAEHMRAMADPRVVRVLAARAIVARRNGADE